MGFQSALYLMWNGRLLSHVLTYFLPCRRANENVEGCLVYSDIRRSTYHQPAHIPPIARPSLIEPNQAQHNVFDTMFEACCLQNCCPFNHLLLPRWQTLFHRASSVRTHFDVKSQVWSWSECVNPVNFSQLELEDPLFLHRSFYFLC